MWLLISCNSSTTSKYSDTPTSGEIIILADESYEPLIRVQIDTFMEIYKYSKINVRYLPESEVFNQLLNNDTIRLAVVSRELKEDEKQFFERHKIIPRTLKVAEDALALIVHPENKDTLLSYENLQNILTGAVQTWAMLEKRKSTDTIIVVFDKSGSSGSRFLKDQFLGEGDFPHNVFAAKSNAEVVEYVSTHKNALGILGLNWISDGDDSVAVSYINKINVVALSSPDTIGSDREYYKPLQAYIALKKYPLIRSVYIISKEGRNGLGTGFASFVAGDKGQRMIRMMGLLPSNMPIRIIKINTE